MLNFIITMLGGHTDKEYLEKICEINMLRCRIRVLENKLSSAEETLKIIGKNNS